MAAFIEREHEFRFVAVEPESLEPGGGADRLAVVCARWDDASYKAARCPPEEWARRYAPHGLAAVWDVGGDVLPCRAYLRHCALAAAALGPAAEASFMRSTFLADGETTIGEWLAARPEILAEAPPASVAGRYSG